jgi:hypothetical protein
MRPIRTHCGPKALNEAPMGPIQVGSEGYDFDY